MVWELRLRVWSSASVSHLGLVSILWRSHDFFAEAVVLHQDEPHFCGVDDLNRMSTDTALSAAGCKAQRIYCMRI